MRQAGKSQFGNVQTGKLAREICCTTVQAHELLTFFSFEMAYVR